MSQNGEIFYFFVIVLAFFLRNVYKHSRKNQKREKRDPFFLKKATQQKEPLASTINPPLSVFSPNPLTQKKRIQLRKKGRIVQLVNGLKSRKDLILLSEILGKNRGSTLFFD